MRIPVTVLASLVLAIALIFAARAPQATADAPLPTGVAPAWELDKAYREQSPTRERICINGLWRWQPAATGSNQVPKGEWGYFKVPAFWPGTTSYIQEDCQTLYTDPTWKGTDLRRITAAWYQREVTIPADWAGRRVAITADYVNSFAVVYVDGARAGEIRFPAGEVEITAKCQPGRKHVLSLLVHALPLKGVLLSHTDTNSAREVKGTVDRRGLCGDVYLVSTPAGARISDVKVDTSVRKGQISVSAAVDQLHPETDYTLHAEIRDQDQVVRRFAGKPFKAADLQAGHITVVDNWKPDRLWDTHTPGNQFTMQVSLRDSDGKTRDVAHPQRFGFREFWIDGRDFYLNGTRIYLSAVPLDNAQVGARTATYEWARETMKRLQSFGINSVYTHNYGCEPGSHVSFAEILWAADDVGMLVALSQPHFAHYDWKAGDADRTNGYTSHAAFYVKVAQNHPSVVAYSMSHNATGYDQDMNPDQIDGLTDPRKDAWSTNNARKALRAEAIVHGLDPGRIVYHHSSGNLGSMHTMNFYLNFAPVQEVSDWFEHWAKKGAKPVFPVEYGVPFTWDWTMYRGWYKGERSFGSARVPWEFCQAEWSAQFLGDRAYRISEREKQNLRWEASQFRAGKLWQRWEYPTVVGSSAFDDRQQVIAQYLTDNWRAHRTTGISANSPWEYAAFWKLRDGVSRKRTELKVDWEKLQMPGFSPDYIAPRSGQMSLDYEAADWLPTAAAEALIRNNRPLLAYIAGPGERFTAKGHNFLPGETVEKQLIVINNSRQQATSDCAWSLAVPTPITGKQRFVIATGEQARYPLHLKLPANLAGGRYELSATFRFDTGEVQHDSFTINVPPRPADVHPSLRIALFDPKGDTAKLLAGMGVRYKQVEASANLSDYDVLVIGRVALTPGGPGPDVSRVRDGLKVIVFEQTARVLEERFGFRVAEYGLRQVFPRVPDHPLLTGVQPDHLHDWRGDATLLPPRLDFTTRPRYGPTVRWCGIEVPRVWRCGNRGNVASVLIERPPCGDFLSILDGGYALQYSAILEYREGKGMVLFCQSDVTGRTEADPAAETLARNLLRYASTWKPRPPRTLLYVGDAAGKRHLESAGFAPRDYKDADLEANSVLVVGPGGTKLLASDRAAIGKWVAGGGSMLALGLEEMDSDLLPVKFTLTKREHIAAYFDPPGVASPFAGIGPADVHNRDPRQIAFVTGGAVPLGDGVLASSREGNVVICQLVPWQSAASTQMNLRRTFRRTSCLLSRLAANVGASATAPLLTRFHSPVDPNATERRWLIGLYLDTPEEWDDPYRFFRW
jgi:hypothetical protein